MCVICAIIYYWSHLCIHIWVTVYWYSYDLRDLFIWLCNESYLCNIYVQSYRNLCSFKSYMSPHIWECLHIYECKYMIFSYFIAHMICIWIIYMQQFLYMTHICDSHNAHICVKSESYTCWYETHTLEPMFYFRSSLDRRSSLDHLWSTFWTNLIYCKRWSKMI